MFVCEPIVLCFSLLSGFSDALIFIFLEAYTPVYKQWGFDVVITSLAFTPRVQHRLSTQVSLLIDVSRFLVGYFIAYFSFFPGIASQQKRLPTRSSAVGASLDRSITICRSLRLQLDKPGSKLWYTMDCTHYLFGARWYSET